jgi:hypothetical protein
LCDDDHSSLFAAGTLKPIDAGQFEQLLTGCLLGWLRKLRGEAEDLAAAAEVLLFGAVGQKAKVTDAHEAVGEDVKKESSDKFHGRQCHGFKLASIFAIPVEESNVAVFDSQDAMVGQGHPMGIASQVVQNFFGRGEGFFEN